LAKYALTIRGVSDIFGVRGRQLLDARVKDLPEHTAFATRRLLDQLESLDDHVQEFEKRMSATFEQTEEIRILKTLPGVGNILAVVIGLEVGRVGRFGGAEKLASYAGTTPRVHASGGKIRYGQLRSDVNRYLKWAFVEAANSICLNQARYPQRHVTKLYRRVRMRKGHQKAIGAVSHHLAEATYWVLTKGEPYREPDCSGFRLRRDKRREP
jgi:transposase